MTYLDVDILKYANKQYWLIRMECPCVLGMHLPRELIWHAQQIMNNLDRRV